jgi:hypothetical protein
MSTSAYHAVTTATQASATSAAARTRTRTIVRVALIAGVVAAAASVALSAHPAVPRDAELARLLRLMASLKAAMLAGAIAVLDWRLRRPAPAALAAAYVALAWVAAGAVTAMWMLAAIGTSAIVMHVAGAALAILAFTDRDFIPAISRSER